MHRENPRWFGWMFPMIRRDVVVVSIKMILYHRYIVILLQINVTKYGFVLLGQVLHICMMKRGASWLYILWISWWRHQMGTFSASLVLCAGNSPVTGEFPASDAELWCKRLSKQSWGWWFETPSHSLWRHCNVVEYSPISCYWGDCDISGYRESQACFWHWYT